MEFWFSPRGGAGSRSEALERVRGDEERQRAELGRFLAAVRRRSRARLLGLGAIRLSEIALLVSLAALAVPAFGGRAAPAAWAVCGLLALGLGLARALRAASFGLDDAALARAVESGPLGARLGDALSGAVDLTRRATPPGVSSALVDLHVARTAAALAGLDPAQGGAPVDWRRALARLGALGALAAAAHALAPTSLGEALARLAAPAAVGPGDGLRRPAGDAALLAGIEVRYRPPAYTGLPERVETGATGDLSGIKGTEVEIRAVTDRPVAEARILLEPGGVVPLAVEGSRRLAGRFTLAEDGFWQAELVSPRGVAAPDPARHTIAVDADQSPEVSLLEPAADVETDERAVVAIAWRAADDFGLADAALVIERAGATERRPLAVAPGAREAKGELRLALAPFGLLAGEELRVHLEAGDDDTVSGPKRSASPPRAIRIRAADQRHDALVAALERLLDDLAGSLDTALVEPVAEARTVRAAAAVEDGLGARLVAHVGAVDEALRELWQDPLGSRESYDVLAAMALRLKELAAESASLLAREAPALARALGDEALVRALGDLRAKEVAELEGDVLAVDDLVRRERAAVLRELARAIADDQRTLAALLEEHRRTGDPAVLAEAHRVLARMQVRVAEFERRAAAAGRAVAEEFVNLDAIREQMRAAASDEMRDLARSLAEGRLDEAGRLAEALAARLARAAAALERGGPTAGALAQARAAGELERAVERLRALIAAEGGLIESTDSVRREQDARARPAGERIGDAAERAQQAARAARAAGAALDADPTLADLGRKRARLDQLTREAAERLARGAPTGALDDLREELFRLRDEVAGPALADRLAARERLREGEQLADEAAQALGARSLDEGLAAAHLAERKLAEARRRLAAEPGQTDRSGAPGASEAQAAAEAVHELVRDLEAVARIGETPGSSDRRDGRRISELARRQRALGAETAEIHDAVRRVAEEQPALDAALPEALGQARDYMEVAARGLDEKDVPAGLRNEVAARDRLEEALDSLEQARQQCQGGGEGAGGGGALAYVPAGVAGEPRFGAGEAGGGGRGTDAGASGRADGKVEIPPVASPAPETFRRDVLEGMKEPRPRGYEQALDEYYRRLVR